MVLAWRSTRRASFLSTATFLNFISFCKAALPLVNHTLRFSLHSVAVAKVFLAYVQVYTVDVTNETAVKEVVHRVMTNDSLSPFIPHEFTQRGLMERVGTFIRHLNFCDGEDLARRKPGESLSLSLSLSCTHTGVCAAQIRILQT